MRVLTRWPFLTSVPLVFNSDGSLYWTCSLPKGSNTMHRLTFSPQYFFGGLSNVSIWDEPCGLVFWQSGQESECTGQRRRHTFISLSSRRFPDSKARKWMPTIPSLLRSRSHRSASGSHTLPDSLLVRPSLSRIDLESRCSNVVHRPRAEVAAEAAPSFFLPAVALLDAPAVLLDSG